MLLITTKYTAMALSTLMCALWYSREYTALMQRISDK